MPKNYQQRDKKLNNRRRGHKAMKMDGKGMRQQYHDRIQALKK